MSDRVYLMNCRGCGYPTPPDDLCPECAVVQTPVPAKYSETVAGLGSRGARRVIVTGAIMLIVPTALAIDLLYGMMNGRSGLPLLAPTGALIFPVLVLLLRAGPGAVLGQRLTQSSVVLLCSAVSCALGAMMVDAFRDTMVPMIILCAGCAVLILTVAYEQRLLAEMFAPPSAVWPAHRRMAMVALWFGAFPLCMLGALVLAHSGLRPFPQSRDILLLVCGPVYFVLSVLVLIRFRRRATATDSTVALVTILALSTIIPALRIPRVMYDILVYDPWIDAPYDLAALFWMLLAMPVLGVLYAGWFRLWRNAAWIAVQSNNA